METIEFFNFSYRVGRGALISLLQNYKYISHILAMDSQLLAVI